MVMAVETSGVMDYLVWASIKFPDFIVDRLIEGQVVRKSKGGNGKLSYIIDDVDIDKKLGNFPSGAIPYQKIHNHFSLNADIGYLFDRSSSVLFSKAFDARQGECLEKAILAQLSAQRGKKSFLINGSLSVDDNFSEAHGYNVVFKEGVAYLLDVQNPLEVDSKGKIIRPYIAKIEGVNSGHDFIVEEGFKDNRVYSLLA